MRLFALLPGLKTSVNCGGGRYEDRSETFTSKSAELKRAEESLQESDKRRVELDQLLSDKKKEIAEIAKALEGAKADERKRVSSDADTDKDLEKILAKRAQHMSKMDLLMAQIRDLGALPKGFQEHSRTAVKVLYKKLSAVNKKLKDQKYRQVRAPFLCVPLFGRPGIGIPDVRVNLSHSRNHL
jgi:septal ring factor EnvC (AmiA/AmiB activator)